jgi:hypothetical protein
MKGLYALNFFSHYFPVVHFLHPKGPFEMREFVAQKKRLAFGVLGHFA